LPRWVGPETPRRRSLTTQYVLLGHWLEVRKPWSICGPIESVSIPPCTDLPGWQPSRFLTDRAEAEHAFALAEQLGSVNAAATELGTTWPSLRKAFTRHGLGMPARNPEAVRQRTIEAARQRTRAAGHPMP
jgi:hypothetical protein